jgi:hypothetical protein
MNSTVPPALLETGAGTICRIDYGGPVGRMNLRVPIGSMERILANLYLHYVLDLWVDQWRRKKATNGHEAGNGGYRPRKV